MSDRPSKTNNHGLFACRIDENGNYKKLPLRDSSVEAKTISFSLQQYRAKITQAERDLIFKYCTETGNERHFVYVLDKAEQRAEKFRRDSDHYLQAAAREEGCYGLVDTALISKWIQNRVEPTLFGDF